MFGLVLPVEGTLIVFAVAPLTAILKDQVSVARTCGHKRGIMLRNNYIPQRIIIAFRVDKSPDPSVRRGHATPD